MRKMPRKKVSVTSNQPTTTNSKNISGLMVQPPVRWTSHRA
jgi:hypothetical protein